MIPAITPVIIRKQAPAPGGYSFTMTAGNYFNAIIGYSSGSLFPAIGEIDSEPVPGTSLVAVMNGRDESNNPLMSIGFAGNVVSILAGKSLWVDGIEYPFDDVWAYSPDADMTGANRLSSSPTFVENGVYFIEIK